jgi:hypothetical protein
MRMLMAALSCLIWFRAEAQPPPVPGSPTSGTTATKEDPWFTKKAKKRDKSIRDLTGTVYGPDNKRLNGALVRLSDTQTGESIDFITLKEGAYRFEDTKRDHIYKIYAEYKGVKSDTRSLTPFDERDEPNLNLNLVPPKPSAKAAPAKTPTTKKP